MDRNKGDNSAAAFLHAGLAEELDKKLLVVLRDGRKLTGYLRSFDQFANLLLEDTHERHIVNDMYADIPLGIYIIRGENVVLLGDIDAQKEESQTRLRQVSIPEILAAEGEIDQHDNSKAPGSTRKSEWLQFDDLF
eukprot:GILK01006165.1.p1 GENE.GILK01006165.1~~GILK01006165.1.p1  ORF type:complete len:136 (+),score=17.30 GILK01006165.1:51-458(+)